MRQRRGAGRNGEKERKDGEKERKEGSWKERRETGGNRDKDGGNEEEVAHSLVVRVKELKIEVRERK